MAIPKVAHQSALLERPTLLFPSARTAFAAFLSRATTRGARIALPAYIGWSPREGSGVFDPVVEAQLTPVFYRLDESLHIDLIDLEARLQDGVRVLVLIHYFGHIDPSYSEAVALGRRYGALIVEDEAHAMFADLHHGRCGRLGDVCLFSLHKLLPVMTGGALVVNPRARALCEGLESSSGITPPWQFDVVPMIHARQRNARLLATRLASLQGRVDPLWTLEGDEIPQTFAVRVRGVSRDTLYEKMNAAGFGVVSLYHTMIEAISAETFPVSHALARSVMNLPVHQEATEESLVAMVDELERLVS
jgi:dTDP-4-amino-4,6-dideoxygalactose transaminase